MTCPDRQPEVRAITTDSALGKLLAGSNSAAGVNVNENSSLTLAAVWRAVTLIGQLVGRMPLHVFQTDANGEDRQRLRNHPAEFILNTDANQYVDAACLRETMTMLALTWGHAEAQIERLGDGTPIGLYLLKPWQTKLTQQPNGSFVYVVTPDRGPAFSIPFADVLSIIGPSPDAVTGYKTIQLARESIALAVAMERFGASYFGNSARPGGVLNVPATTPDGKPFVMDDTVFNRLRESFNEKYKGANKTGEVVLLEGGVTFSPFELKNDEAQFIASRTFQIAEVARWFGVAPHLLFELTRATFSNIEEQGQDFLTYCLDPWVDRWERECRRKLLPYGARDVYVEAVVDAILRASTEKRYAAYNVACGRPWMTVNEVRRKENMSPVEGGDVLLAPLNMGAPADKPVDKPAPTDPTPAADPAPPEQNSADDHVAQAMRELLVSTIGRVLSIQGKAAVRAAGKPAAFTSWLDEFTTSQRRVAEDALGPTFRAAISALKLDNLPGRDVEHWAERVVNESRQRLLEASGQATPEQLVAVVQAEVDQWEQRAASTADQIFPKQGGQ